MREHDEKYTAREKVLNEASRRSEEPGVSLGDLVALMKEGSASKSYLSSLYFAGAEGDHPYFLKNDRVAMGLAVLPEDAEKAGLSKRHPHQKEVIIVLDGVLHLEIVKQSGVRVEVDLSRGDLYVIEEGECHRITPVNDQDAAFLFVKTNPAQEPRGEDCSL